MMQQALFDDYEGPTTPTPKPTRKLPELRSPYPYFGGKMTIANKVWELFGDVKNYVEPFFGSGAVLLARPNVDLDNLPLETVNDKDGFIVNFWRAIQSDVEQVAYYADGLVSSIDRQAREAWLVNRKERLQWCLEDPDFYDAKIAGWWVYCICAYIGSGFCSGKGAWTSNGVNLTRKEKDDGKNTSKQSVHLGNLGRGIHKKGITRSMMLLGSKNSTGVGIHASRAFNNGHILDYLTTLALRVRRVRVTCGEWDSILGKAPTYSNGLTAVFLDPPYSATKNKVDKVYEHFDGDIAQKTNQWCVENMGNPLLKIVLCGYDDEHTNLTELGWDKEHYKVSGGYSKLSQTVNDNCNKETIWWNF